MNDITFWVLLLMMIHFSFIAKLADIKTAFLYGSLKKKFIWNAPWYERHWEKSDMKDIGKDHCIILGKCIYGIGQAARQYNKR